MPGSLSNISQQEAISTETQTKELECGVIAKGEHKKKSR